jgi:hypothetical protein
MTENPYAPPKAPVSDVAVAPNLSTPTYVLYSPRQFFIAAFLGSPLAASWLASRNLWALSRHVLAKRILLAGLITTVAIFAIAFAVPDGQHIPNTLIPLIYSLLIRWYAHSYFGDTYESHIKSGGRRGSYWSVVGISLACIVAIMAAVVGGIFAWSYLTGGKVVL